MQSCVFSPFCVKCNGRFAASFCRVRFMLDGRQLFVSFGKPFLPHGAIELISTAVVIVHGDGTPFIKQMQASLRFYSDLAFVDWMSLFYSMACTINGTYKFVHKKFIILERKIMPPTKQPPTKQVRG